MSIKPYLIELASKEEQLEFIQQEYVKNTDNLQGCSMDGVATYFSHMHNIRFSKQQWTDSIWPTLYSITTLSKSSCIALREAELNLPHVDVGASDLPRVERFSDLPDGTLFYLAQTYVYGGRQKCQKTLEDGGDHNAVYANDTNLTMTVPDMQLVFRA